MKAWGWLVLVVLSGCIPAQNEILPTIDSLEMSSPTMTDPTARPTTTTEPGYVSREMYGETWAFTVEDGVLHCLSGSRVVFVAGGVTYALNGLAQGWAERMGWRLIDEIWRDHPTGPLPKVSLAPFTQLGLSLCD